MYAAFMDIQVLARSVYVPAPSPASIGQRTETRALLEGNRLLHGQSQAAEVFLAGNGDAAQLRGDRCEHLNVKQHEALPAQVLDQVEQCNLGGIADAVEHGFAREQAAYRDPVNAPDEAAALPALQTVGVAKFVQLRVGCDKLGADPSAPAPQRASRAPPHHPSKCVIHSDAGHPLPDDLRQAVRHMEAV